MPDAPPDSVESGDPAKSSWYTRNRERVLEAARLRYETDPEFRESARAASKERYHTDPDYRTATIKRAKKRNKAVREGVPPKPPRPPKPPKPRRRRGKKPDTVRHQAVWKLRTGSGPLTAEELERVPPANRPAAAEVRPRTLAEVAALIGVSPQRVCQILNHVATARANDGGQADGG